MTENKARQLDLEVEVGFGSGELLISGDPVQLSQVLLNVLLNAYQALERQGSAGARSVAILRDIRQVGKRQFHRLGVRDNGPGIPEESMEDVFNPYFTTRAEGTGLGLSISNRIMEAHGGYIDIDSEHGQTTVWLSFPSEPGL